MKLARALQFTLFAIASVFDCSGQDTIYQIGNSLTWDSKPSSVWSMSQGLTRSYSGGYHIHCGASLATIAAENGTCITPTSFGRWRDALPQYEWDHVLLQVFRQHDATLASDRDAIWTFANAALENPGNSETQWWIYQSWPFKNGVEPWEDWLTPAGSRTRHRQAYYRQLQETLGSEGLELGMIPIGDVFFHLRNQAEQYDWIGDWTELYRDDAHLDAIGRFIVGTTILTALHGEDITGTPKVGYGPYLTREEQDSIQTLVWKVVNHYQNAGDFNLDGDVDLLDRDLWQELQGTTDLAADGNLDGWVDDADLELWQSAYALSVPGDFDRSGAVDHDDYLLWRSQYGLGGPVLADGNLDGVVDAADYAVWRNAYTAPPQSVAVVPAPGSFTLLVLVAAGSLSRRPRKRMVFASRLRR